MGSPAVSGSNNLSISLITWVFFFHRLAPTACFPDPVHIHILREQLTAPFGYGVRIQLQKFGNLLISAATQLERLQAGVQPALLFV
jgi:hypothetical protein